MAEGREYAAIALPFCAGNVTGMLLQDYMLTGCGPFVPVILIVAVCLLSVALFLTRNKDGALSPTLQLCIWFLTGWFCLASYEAAGPSAASGTGPLMRAAESSAAVLKKLIADLPFENPDCNALASALVTGDRSLLSKEITASFRESGASHLLALSGMHLGIIYMIITKPFAVIRKSMSSKIARFIAICSATGFYTLMTGASPSTVRAFLFIMMSEAAILMGRRRKALAALCTALTVQSALNPGVIRSASFQLSYLAVCGIILLYPKLRDLYPHNKKEIGFRSIMFRIWDSAALTIACQIFTGPLAWLLFDSAPMYFLIANLIAVPLTTLVIPLVLGLVGLELLGLDWGPAVWTVELAVQALISSIDVIGGL